MTVHQRRFPRALHTFMLRNEILEFLALLRILSATFRRLYTTRLRLWLNAKHIVTAQIKPINDYVA